MRGFWSAVTSVTPAVLSFGVITVVAACSPVSAGGGAGSSSPSVSAVSAARITVSPDNPANPKKTPFNRPVVVQVENGTLTDVKVVGPNGPMKGTWNTDRTRWRSKSSLLHVNARYKTTATAVDGNGVPVTVQDSFKTIKPKAFVTVSDTTVRDGGVYGVGMPITITFSSPVKTKRQIAERLHLTSNRTFVGAWKWTSDTTITFRPKSQYPANTRIQLDAQLKGVPFGDNTFGKENLSREFKIGTAFNMVVNAKTHRMKVYKNGDLIRDIPITTGKPGYDTRSGVKVIMSKEETTVMTAPGRSPGDPEYYRLDVDKAMRVTWSGEYVHAAPWSVDSQGYDNVSHGCIGMSDSNAGWLFARAKVGDIVVVSGTPVKQDLGNGWTDWNIPWKTWVADSATGGPVTVQPGA